MVWTGGGSYTLAHALQVLLEQLEHNYPAQAWQVSPQTGTIGDAAHLSEGNASDHNPWLNNTVRALDVAADTPGGPDAEYLFRMVNAMYAQQDPRVYPDGYAIFNGRITDWGNPGGYHAQQGDPHLYHVHISVSTNPSGYGSTALWPLQTAERPETGPTTPVVVPAQSQEDEVVTLVQTDTKKWFLFYSDGTSDQGLTDGDAGSVRAAISPKALDVRLNVAEADVVRTLRWYQARKAVTP